MSQFFLDLGFDFGALQKPNTLSFLQNGLLTDGESAFPRIIQIGDTITFNAFNLTSGASIGDDTTIIGGSLIFTSALASQATPDSPFSSAKITTATGALTTLLASIAFNPNVPVPFMTIASQTVVNKGSFLFTIALVVQGTATSNVGTNNVRTFVVDPEMIVWGPGN